MAALTSGGAQVWLKRPFLLTRSAASHNVNSDKKVTGVLWILS